jgi:hypothetical protein
MMLLRTDYGLATILLLAGLCALPAGCKKKAGGSPEGPAFSTKAPGEAQAPAGMPAQRPAGMPGAEQCSECEAAARDFTGLERAEGGQTVAELFARAGELHGQEVKVRGKVVKFNPNIMGVNWLHLRDGTGEDGANDLTVKTLSLAKVGDTVLVTGTLTSGGENFHGNNYAAVVDNGTAIVE